MPSASTALKHLTSAGIKSLNQTTQYIARRSFTASAIMGKQEWMCICPDKPNSLDARMKIRPQHLEDIKPKVQSGLIVMGGASLNEPIQDGKGPAINGSILIVESDTREEAEAVVKGDIYYKEGVWDAEKVQIFPFKSAVRQSL